MEKKNPFTFSVIQFSRITRNYFINEFLLNKSDMQFAFPIISDGKNSSSFLLIIISRFPYERCGKA